MAARVPGALARSGKKRAVLAFANKREPELFPSGEAGRAAPYLPSRHLVALGSRAGVPAPLAARCGLPAGARTEQHPAAGGGRRCRRGCSMALRLQSPSLQLESCRTREQQVAEDAESSTPTCGAPGPGGRNASLLGLCLLFTR